MLSLAAAGTFVLLSPQRPALLEPLPAAATSSSTASLLLLPGSWSYGSLPMLHDHEQRTTHICFDSASFIAFGGDCLLFQRSSGKRACLQLTSVWDAKAVCSRHPYCEAVVLATAARATDEVAFRSGPWFELRTSRSSKTAATIAEPELVWRVGQCGKSLTTEAAATMNVHFTIKSSSAGDLHTKRVLPQLRSWVSAAGVQASTYIFTDAAEDRPSLVGLAGGRRHWVATDCGSGHGRELCCKTESELLHFVEILHALPPSVVDNRPYWWCHVDDDNYVNVAALKRFLAALSTPTTTRYYIGRPGPSKTGRPPFAMGGAGYCVNAPAALAANRYLVDQQQNRSYQDSGRGSARGGFVALCEETHQPDDVSMGILFGQRVQPSVGLTEDPETALHAPHTGQHSNKHTISGSRFHSQWEQYGESLQSLMSTLRERWSEELVPALYQFTYGWDRYSAKDHSSGIRDMMQLHYLLETLDHEASGQSTAVCYETGGAKPATGAKDVVGSPQTNSLAHALFYCSADEHCTTVVRGDDGDSFRLKAEPLGVDVGTTKRHDHDGHPAKNNIWRKQQARLGHCLEPEIYGYSEMIWPVAQQRMRPGGA